MRPGQLHPNELEIAVLEHFAQDNPWLQVPFTALHVLSRKYTGVGCYTEFLCDVPAQAGDPSPGLQNMRLITLLSFLLVLALPLHAELTDAQLTRLMVGAWRSPRHDYIYSADGTWSMGTPDPHTMHGRWWISDHHLQTVFTDYGYIHKLTQHEIVFGRGYRLKRIRLRDVDGPQ